MSLWRSDESEDLDWQQVYGGTSTDYANDVAERSIGGFILGGNTTRSS